ncbi:MAG TPA: DUF2007 domain-containing protein [Candidatus Acidoferrales bacterium]|nr:DUF2007 domain-containing protein [Candidatus Acidoferrales bacterium]
MTRELKDEELVIARAYSYRHEAEIGKSMLEANGIDAMIYSDDSGGEYPSLSSSNGVRVIVRRSDVETARKLLG